MTSPSDPGPALIDQLYTTLEIEDEWSLRSSRAFTWWGDHLAQRVWAAPPREGDTSVVRVHAETAFLREVHDSPETAARLAALNRFATLSALAWKRESREVWLHAVAYVHHENVAWMRPLLAKVLALQVTQAHAEVDEACALLGGEIASSDHPGSGRRKAPDLRLEQLGAIYAREGSGESPFSEADFDALLGLEPRPWLTARREGRGLVAELPAGGDGEETATLVATADTTHPRFGSGLHLRVGPPVPAGAGMAGIAAQLNAAEAEEWTGTSFMGAWCSGHDDRLWFGVFVPATLYEPGVLARLLADAAARVRWTGAWLREQAPAGRL